jgi:hypothetical protein
MKNKVKRPPTVWLTQFLLTLLGLLWLFVILSGIPHIPRRLEEGTSVIRLFSGYAVLSAIVILLAFAFWGLAKRKMYGRWLGLVCLILLWIIATYTQIRPPQGPIPLYQFNSPAEKVGGVIGQVLIQIVFLVLVVRLGTAKWVREFFQSDRPLN